MKITLTMLFAAAMVSSCRTTYIKKFHKDAKREDVGSAKIKLKSDTVRVVYQELSMFDFGKDEIKTDAQAPLKRLAGLLSRYDKIDFVINGYTDNVGTDEVNNDLSQRRADNAKTLFETNGVGATRIETHGKGATNFVEPNTTEEGKAANRRVELLMYERK